MTLTIHTHVGKGLADHFPRWVAFLTRTTPLPLSRHPAWLLVFQEGLNHIPYCLEARAGEETRGLLPLALVKSFLFGRFLVSLPYVNYGGVSGSDEASHALINHATKLADQERVRFLELRQEKAVDDPALHARNSQKVCMRLHLPSTPEQLWSQLDTKVRNQVRKAEKNNLTVLWGKDNRLADFYDAFSHNMRDLGTPVYGRGLFKAILRHFPEQAEIAVVQAGGKTVAAGLLLHGWGISEVPSAGMFHDYRSSNANMLLYWRLLQRAIERGQTVFDFGRSTRGSGTYRFKEQWGALPHPSEWQYYVREGTMKDMRPDNPKYERFIRFWQRLPLGVTRFLGPWIVRGIP